MKGKGFDDAEYLARFFAWINERWVDKNCPKCRKNSWLKPSIVTIQVQPVVNNDVVLGGSQVPAATMMCSNCGHIELINLVVAGLWGDERIPEKSL